MSEEFDMISHICTVALDEMPADSFGVRCLKLWLRKVYTYKCHRAGDSRIRNAFLCCLSKCLAEGVLVGPFKRVPPPGRLPDLPFHRYKFPTALERQAANCGSGDGPNVAGVAVGAVGAATMAGGNTHDEYRHFIPLPEVPGLDCLCCGRNLFESLRNGGPNVARIRIRERGNEQEVATGDEPNPQPPPAPERVRHRDRPREQVERERQERVARVRAERARAERELAETEREREDREREELEEEEREREERRDLELVLRERMTRQRQAQERERFARERKEREQLELQRIAQAQIEAQRLQVERTERERAERERAMLNEAERAGADRGRAGREALDRARVEREQAYRTRAERERLEQDRAEGVRLEGVERVDRDRVERMRAELVRMGREREEREQQRREQRDQLLAQARHNELERNRELERFHERVREQLRDQAVVRPAGLQQIIAREHQREDELSRLLDSYRNVDHFNANGEQGNNQGGDGLPGREPSLDYDTFRQPGLFQGTPRNAVRSPAAARQPEPVDPEIENRINAVIRSFAHATVDDNNRHGLCPCTIAHFDYIRIGLLRHFIESSRTAATQEQRAPTGGDNSLPSPSATVTLSLGCADDLARPHVTSFDERFDERFDDHLEREFSALNLEAQPSDRSRLSSAASGVSTQRNCPSQAGTQFDAGETDRLSSDRTQRNESEFSDLDLSSGPSTGGRAPPSSQNQENHDLRQYIRSLLRSIGDELEGNTNIGANFMLEYELPIYMRYHRRVSAHSRVLNALEGRTTQRTYLLLSLREDLRGILRLITTHSLNDCNECCVNHNTHDPGLRASSAIDQEEVRQNVARQLAEYWFNEIRDSTSPPPGDRTYRVDTPGQQRNQQPAEEQHPPADTPDPRAARKQPGPRKK